MLEGFGLVEEGPDWKEWHQWDQNMLVGLFEKTAPGSFPSWNMLQLFMVLRGGKYSVINKWELISWRDSVWVGRSLCCFWTAESLFLVGQEFGWVSADGCGQALQAAQGRAEIQNYMCQPTTNHHCSQGGPAKYRFLSLGSRGTCHTFQTKHGELHQFEGMPCWNLQHKPADLSMATYPIAPRL